MRRLGRRLAAAAGAGLALAAALGGAAARGDGAAVVTTDLTEATASGGREFDFVTQSFYAGDDCTDETPVVSFQWAIGVCLRIVDTSTGNFDDLDPGATLEHVSYSCEQSGGEEKVFVRHYPASDSLCLGAATRTTNHSQSACIEDIDVRGSVETFLDVTLEAFNASSTDYICSAAPGRASAALALLVAAASAAAARSSF